MNYLSNCIADFYVKRNIIEESDKEVYQAGVSLVLNEALSFILVVALSWFVWEIRYSFEFLIVFCITRVFCGGFHAKKTYICRMTMLTTFVCVIMISSFLGKFSTEILWLINLISFLVLLPLIPVKHPNKELTQELIKVNRKKGVITYILFGLCSVLVAEYLSVKDGFVMALSLSAVTVLAIVGTISNERRKKYEKVDK